MAKHRIEKINEAIKKHIAKIVLQESEDPRFTETILTITKVDTTRDLKYAKVYFSVLETSKRHDVERAFKSAKPFLMSRLRKLMIIKSVPDLSFHYDESLLKMSGVLNKITDEKKKFNSSEMKNENN